MWLPRVVDWTEQDYVLDCLRFEFRCLGYWFTHGPVTILNAWCCIGAWMRDLNSMSEESVSVREEERSDWEDAIGQDNHVGAVDGIGELHEVALDRSMGVRRAGCVGERMAYDLLHQKEAILKKATTTMDFRKLLGEKTIGCDVVIVQDIVRILAQSQ
ncbi:hypothetical protein V6N13_072917 [Hibiscus sabdariffa]